jgi:iron complex outermembrane receptor protein
MVWGAVSKAGRIPASTDEGLRVNFVAFPGPGGLPTVLSSLGNPHFKNEGLTAYEAGYRAAVGDRVSIDVALFYNDYDDQGTAEPAAAFLETTPAPAHLVIPLVAQNLMQGETHGLEIAANWKVTERWTITPGYAFEQIHMHTDAASRDTESAGEAEGSSPMHSAEVRSHVRLPYAMGWNASVYFVDRLRDLNIPSYVRLDTGIDWRWKENLVVSVVGQNLQKDHHEEFLDTNGSVNSGLMKRSAYLKLTYRF